MTMTHVGLAGIRNVNRELQIAIKTGKVLIGSKETLKALRKEDVKIVIHSSNCPKEIRENFEDKNIVIYEYPTNNIELGLACGKPYSVASLCILDAGDSEILRLLSSSSTMVFKTLEVTETDHKAG